MGKVSKKLWLCLVVCICLAALTGCSKSGDKEVKSAEQVSDVWGQADATEVDLNPKVAGRLVKVLVKEGDVVKKGQLLAQIDSREQDAKTKASEAQVEAAKAVALQAKASLDNTQTDYNRYSKLYSEGAVSESVFDAYKTKLKVAVATYNQAEQSVSAAQEALRQNNINLGETDIFAPFDGIITTKYANEGAMMSTGMPIVAVQDPKDNWVNLSTYFKYPQEVRTLIYTTNTIEGFNRQLRKVTKSKTVFPTDDSLLKMLYLAMTDITKKWTGRRKDWGIIHSQLEIYFPGRMG